MIDSKIVISLAGLLASVFAFNSIQNKKSDIKENMTSAWGLQYNTVNDVVSRNSNGQVQSLPRGASMMINKAMGANPNAGFYTVPQNFQSNIAPRMFAGDYGANITYNLPSKEHLAVPENPLGYADKVLQSQDFMENYIPNSCGSGGQPLSYHGGAPLMTGDYSQGNYEDVRGQLYSQKNNMKASHAALPLGDMTVIDPTTGNPENVIIADRLMYANIKPANSIGQGDMIRGDIPIAPMANIGWFNTSQSTQPGQYLQQGAMNVMGGIDNDTSKQLANIIHASSGNVKTAIGGANLTRQFANPNSSLRQAYARNPLNNVNMNNQYNTSLIDNQATVNVTAFP
jgi:hypothetical protein